VETIGGLGVRRANFTIKDGIKGPFNLYFTMKSGHTAEPEWQTAASGFWEGINLDGGFVKVTVSQGGSVDEPELFVEAIPGRGLSLQPGMMDVIRDHLTSLFTLGYDLESFYSKFRGDIIGGIIPEVRGLRLMHGRSPFKSLICSILSQHATVLQWNLWARRISNLFSQPVKFDDGTVYHPFPDPRTLASADIRVLEGCGIGYRARYVVEASSKVVAGELSFSRLRDMGYLEARSELMVVRGIGPKVADCFLLYGLGMGEAAPVDLWIHRIVSERYFNGAKVGKEYVNKFLRDRYGSYAGLAQLYLYHYGRKFWGSRYESSSSPSKPFKPKDG
jgi:N-glycosylase/DNA lyase